MPAYDGRLYLADTSAWTHLHKSAEVQEEFSEALHADQIGTCPIVVLELLRGASTLPDVEALGARFSALRMHPTTHSVCLAAIWSIGQLAELAPGPNYHRVAICDALVAATAQDRGVGVLHYDHHFDRLEQVVDFESRWIAPAGSL